MRATKSFGALVASSLLHQSTAQAPAYGSPNGGSAPDTYGKPDGDPQGGFSTTPGGLPPSGPTCVMQGTTTVFITVYPTSPMSPAGGSPSEGSGTDQTVQTLYPTRTVRVSPLDSAQATQSTVSPFTTLTIDIWGHGADSGDKSGKAVTGSGSPSAGDASQGSHASVPAGYGVDKNGPLPNPTAAAESAGPHGASDGTTVNGGPPVSAGLTAGLNGSPYGSVNPAQATANAGERGPGGSSPWYTVVTDTEVHWVTGSAGPSPVTVLSEHTIFVSGQTDAPSNGNPVTCLTTTGPDGRPTILEWPVRNPHDNSGQPVSTSAGFPVGNAPQTVSTAINPPWPGVTGSSVGGVPAPGGSGLTTTCTTYTVLGPDGIPTVVHSSWVVPQSVPVTAVSGALPTDVSGPTQTQIIPNGAGTTTCTSYTLLGADGKPTVVESTLVLPGPANTQAGVPGNPPNGVPILVSPIPGIPGPVQSGGSGLQGGVITSTTYTVLGADGRPTVVDTTYVVPGPFVTPFPPNIPGGVITGAPSQVTLSLGNPQPANIGSNGITTCITYTAIGIDGKPTIVESTVVIPASEALPTASNIGLPSFVPQSQPNLPQGLPPFTSAESLITTCITIDVVGPNGVATPVVETVVLTPAGEAGATLSTGTVLGLPQQLPPDLPQGIPPFTSSNNAVTTCITVDVLGPNGVVTPVVQTIVFTPSAAGIGLPTASAVVNTAALPAPPSGPVVIQGGTLYTLGSGTPSLNAYGTNVPDLQTGLPPSAVVSGIDVATVTGTRTATLTVIAGPNGSPVLSVVSGLPLPSGSGPDGNGAPGNGVGELPANGYGWSSSIAGLYGPLSSLFAPLAAGITTTLQTSTWTNVIPEQTTTYTIGFPLTTLATVAVPAPLSLGKRAIRRQESSSLSASSWSNATATLSPLPTPPGAGQGGSSSTMCSAGGPIGNTTVNFDNVKPGPLFNPSGDLWFSEGFLVAPPSSQQSQSYVPSSGGQLVEFVPPSVSTTQGAQGKSDTAEIGVGPNSVNPCFRFDFFSADLGCAAEGREQWCEFEVSAYTYSEASFSEQSIAWSETKRVPACPNFPDRSCSLTPVDFEGYTNITSVLIRLHVGLDLRAWWGDDFKFGWADNSCEAASCRARTAPHSVKRETVESALRRGVWHWTPAGLQRLDDEYIWESVY